MQGEMIGMAAVLLMFGVIPVTAGIVLFKLKARKMDTLVKVVELGGNVDADMMKLLSDGPTNYKIDYKWGLIWLAIGIPVTLGLWVQVGIDQAIWGLIPVFIGIAFIISGSAKGSGNWMNSHFVIFDDQLSFR